MYHRPACVVVEQAEFFLMMLSEVSTPPRSPKYSALGTRMQNLDTPWTVVAYRSDVIPDCIVSSVCMCVSMCVNFQKDTLLLSDRKSSRFLWRTTTQQSDMS